MPGRDPVVKAFAALMHMVESGRSEWSARTLARELGVPLSTAHRVLAGLVRADVLVRDADTSSYVFGDRLQRISGLLVEAFPAPKLARPHLEALTCDTEETSLFALYDEDGAQVTFVAQVEGPHELRYVVPLQVPVPINLAATGVVFVAFLGTDARERLLARLGLSRAAQRALLSACAETRARGYAISQGQRARGAVGIAAPVFDRWGRVLGSLVVTIPETRFSDDREHVIAGTVCERARQLTLELGGRAAEPGLDGEPPGRDAAISAVRRQPRQPH